MKYTQLNLFETKPVIKQKYKFELQKEVEELKKRNEILNRNQKPLPDNVEDVKYEPATGTFKGQSTSKDFTGGEAIKMNEQYDRIGPADKNLLKRIERIKYENNELEEKPLWLEKEEEQKKKLQKPKRRNYFDDTVKLNAGNKGELKLPKLTPEEIKRAQEPSTWDLIKKTANTPQEISDIRKIVNENHKKFPSLTSKDELKYLDKKPEEQKTFINDPGLNLLERNLSKQDSRPIEQIIKERADRRLEHEQKTWDREWGRGGITDLSRPE